MSAFRDPAGGRAARCVALPAIVFALAVTGAFAAAAQSTSPGGMPPPPGMSLEQSAAMRFPQPVRAGDLIDRSVLQPVPDRVRLGAVRQVVRDRAGAVAVVMGFGGILGVGERPIAVPLDAMVLLGDEMEVVAFTPEQLRGFPSFTSGDWTPLSRDEVIRVGLAKPSH